MQEGDGTNLDAAIESLLNVEKQMRLAGDVAGTRKAVIDIVELCYKDDELGDPMLNWYHFRELGVSDEDLEFCEELGLKVNEILTPFFDERGVTLVDFKIEVGRDAEGRLVLADEISPDTCRFWDKETGEKLDKDRFRRDMGGVEEAYAEMLRRVQEITQRGAVD